MYRVNLVRIFEKNLGRRYFATGAKVPLQGLSIPKQELRQLYHFIHPDKFEGANLKEAKTANLRSLQQLNLIVEYATNVHKEVSRNGVREWFL